MVSLFEWEWIPRLLEIPIYYTTKQNNKLFFELYYIWCYSCLMLLSTKIKTACWVLGDLLSISLLSVWLKGEHILFSPRQHLAQDLWHSVGNYFAVNKLLKTFLAKQNILSNSFSSFKIYAYYFWHMREMPISKKSFKVKNGL